jgi:hypothetical protein
MDIAPLATAQLVASVVNTVRAARDLARDTTNHELKEKIGEVYDGLMDLRERLFNLDEENRQLKAELEKKAEIEGPVPPFGYFFDKRHPDAPLCPKCYQQSDSRVSFMGPLQPWNRGERRLCRNCGHGIYEKEMDLSPRSPQSRRPYNTWG